MRRLPVPQRSRAALWSVAGHGGLVAALAFVGTRTDVAPFERESPLIFAELVTAVAPEAGAAADVDVAPQQDEAIEPAEEPATVAANEPLEPTPTAATEAPEPAAVAPAPPAPSAPREAEPQEAPSPEPLPEPPAEQQPAESDPAPDEADPRLAEAVEPAPATTPAPDPAPIPELPAGLPETATAAATPSRTLASYEAEAVRSKLASWTGRISADDPEPTLTWRDDGQQYTAVLRKVAAPDATGMEQLAVELTTERDGERLVAEVRMNRLAFSNFGQFVNRWDPDVQIHDDVIDGRLHSNTALTIGRSGGTTPVFRGKVTIADGGFVTTGPGFISRHKLFPGGIETRTRRIQLPERAAKLESIAGPANSERFVRDTAVTFHADGSVSWRERGGATADLKRALGDEPFYLLGADGVDLEVSGTVNGKVLVYALESIVITGDLRYATDPRAPRADDYLGLVAERTVEIAEPDVTGTGDLEVYASIYARQRFAVRNYSSRRSGTLVIHGSLTAGTLTATEPRFATRIEFDDRLTTMRAPSFPLSDRYELDTMSGEWRVVGAEN